MFYTAILVRVVFIRVEREERVDGAHKDRVDAAREVRVDGRRG